MEYSTIGSFAFNNKSSSWIDADSDAATIQTEILGMGYEFAGVLVSAISVSDTVREWDITFTSLMYADHSPFLNVSAYSNKDALLSVDLTILSFGWASPVYDLFISNSSSISHEVELFWKTNSSIGLFSTNTTAEYMKIKITNSSIFSYVRVDSAILGDGKHFYLLLVSTQSLNETISSQLTCKFTDVPHMQAVPLLTPQYPISSSLDSYVSFTFHDIGCVETNGGVRCNRNYSDEMTPPLLLPAASDDMVVNLETLRDVHKVLISTTSLSHTFDTDSNYILQGLRYSITFIEFSMNSTATAVTSSNEFTWGPPSDITRYAGDTYRLYDIPPLSVVAISAVTTRRQLATSTGLKSTGWTAVVKEAVKGSDAKAGTTVPVEVSMNGQDYTSSGTNTKFIIHQS